jgi:hypothetical protein
MVIAQGKRGTSAALGYGPEMIFSFFPFGLARLERAKPEGKKEVGYGGALPRAAASAALPWATILLPHQGTGKANQSWQPTPGYGQAVFPLPLAGSVCTLRSDSGSMYHAKTRRRQDDGE